MSRIVLYLPMNFFHGNLSEEAGLDYFRSIESNIDLLKIQQTNVAISWQKLDEEFFPELKELVNSPHLSVLNSTFSHALPAAYSEGTQRDMWAREIETGVKGNVDCMFFPEFCAPSKFFSTKKYSKYFLVLDTQTTLYSYNLFSLYPVEPNIIPDAPAIRCGDKIGLIMKEKLFSGFLKAFFAWQRSPYDIVAQNIMIDELDKIIMLPDDQTIIIPIDWEAPWVGSLYGHEIWFKFFEIIGLRSENFVPLSSVMDDMAEQAIATHHPHRNLMKWFSDEISLKTHDKIAAITPKTEYEKMLLSVASGSDLPASFFGKYHPMKLKASHPRSGELVDLVIGHNQIAIEVALAALRALQSGESFTAMLDEITREESDNQCKSLNFKDNPWFVKMREVAQSWENMA